MIRVEDVLTRVPRRSMRPGEVFGITTVLNSRGYQLTRRDAWVVVDAATEVNFWTGARACFGECASAMCVQVLSGRKVT